MGFNCTVPAVLLAPLQRLLPPWDSLRPSWASCNCPLQTPTLSLSPSRCCKSFQHLPPPQRGSPVLRRTLCGGQWVLQEQTQRHPERRHLFCLRRWVPFLPNSPGLIPAWIGAMKYTCNIKYSDFILEHFPYRYNRSGLQNSTQIRYRRGENKAHSLMICFNKPQYLFSCFTVSHNLFQPWFIA